MFKRVIIAPRLIKFLSNNFARAMALYPFVLVKDERLATQAILIHHEYIHIRQQIEMGILLFYIWYGIEYVIRFMQYKTQYDAYRNISFEREAYANQEQLSYLKHRKFWQFLKYLKKN